MKDNRPTFCYKGNPDHHIRAGGLILYRFTDDMDEPELLMIKSRNRFEDFGGKTDIVDQSIEETICREAKEESNGVLPMNEMMDLVKDIEPVYSVNSKYLVYIAKTDKNYLPKDFGKWEKHDRIPRTVEWIKLSQLMNNKFIKNKLHIRLKFTLFFDRVRKLKHSK